MILIAKKKYNPKAIDLEKHHQFNNWFTAILGNIYSAGTLVKAVYLETVIVNIISAESSYHPRDG